MNRIKQRKRNCVSSDLQLVPAVGRERSDAAWCQPTSEGDEADEGELNRPERLPDVV